MHCVVQPNDYVPFGELLEADLQSPVLVGVLVWRNVQEALCNVEGTLVDRSGNATLKLHLQQFCVRRMLPQCVFHALNLVLHAHDGHLKRWKVNLSNEHIRLGVFPRNNNRGTYSIKFNNFASFLHVRKALH